MLARFHSITSSSSSSTSSLLLSHSSSSAASPSHSPTSSIHFHSQFLLIRHTHNRNVPPRSESPRPQRSSGGSVLDGTYVSSLTPTKAKEKVNRVVDGISRTYYYVFGAVLVAVMSAAAFTIGVFYFYNPEAEVRERTTRILQSNPTALRVLGQPMRDITERVKGSRGMQAHHRFPYIGEHAIDMSYVLSGRTSGETVVVVQFLKSGSIWKPLYIHLDTRKGRVLILDHRSGNNFGSI